MRKEGIYCHQYLPLLLQLCGLQRRSSQPSAECFPVKGKGLHHYFILLHFRSCVFKHIRQRIIFHAISNLCTRSSVMNCHMVFSKIFHLGFFPSPEASVAKTHQQQQLKPSTRERQKSCQFFLRKRSHG